MKTLVVTEKKSVADDFAKVLGGFKKKELAYERDDMVIAWASGHLLELQNPSAYDDKFKRWALGDLPIIPKKFERVPREGQGKAKELLKRLVKYMKAKDVGTIVNACDAGREGELIFNLVLDHAGFGDEGKAEASGKTIQRLWLQSMTAKSIRNAFDGIVSAKDYAPLRQAAYARDEADWMVGMNGTRAFTKKFMGRARQFFAVGRVKTPTLAFLVDREREIDAFTPVPYFQIDAVFDTGKDTYDSRWSGVNETGKKADRLLNKETADAIVAKVTGKAGIATEKHTKRSEAPPLLYDLTTIQREASNRFGYTLDRTLSIVQRLYEAKKAVTYPRTSSRYLPTDYAEEIPKLVTALRAGELGHVADRALAEAGGTAEQLQPVKYERVFNDAKVSDHFALIPTGENPKSLKEDEAKIYEIIVRRFFAVFLPPAKWENVNRETVVEGESFVTRSRRLATPGWRAVEPAPDHKDLPALNEEGSVTTKEIELLEKETQPPSRYTDGSLVKAMETAGRDVSRPSGEEGEGVLDEEVLEELKEKGIGTPATRANIVEDLIRKRLSRRQGRTIIATPLGCTLVRLMRNLDLGDLAKPDMTGTWEYRLAQMSEGHYSRAEWDKEVRDMVRKFVDVLKTREGGNEEIFAVDHPKGAKMLSPDGHPLIEKTFSYMSSDAEEDFNISKNQKGKYLFPETLVKLLAEKKIGPMTGFEGTKAPGFLVLQDDGLVEVELDTSKMDDDDEESTPGEFQREVVPEGTVMGKCPKCGGEVTRQGSGYKCEKNIPRKKDKECDFRLAERIKYRYLPSDQIKLMLNGGKTEELFGFVSMRGRKFKASLSYKDGDLQWEFPPRKTKKKASKKKAAKKKATKKKAAKKKATKKKASKKATTKKVAPKKTADD